MAELVRCGVLANCMRGNARPWYTASACITVLSRSSSHMFAKVTFTAALISASVCFCVCLLPRRGVPEFGVNLEMSDLTMLGRCVCLRVKACCCCCGVRPGVRGDRGESADTLWRGEFVATSASSTERFCSLCCVCMCVCARVCAGGAPLLHTRRQTLGAHACDHQQHRATAIKGTNVLLVNHTPESLPGFVVGIARACVRLRMC